MLAFQNIIGHQDIIRTLETALREDKAGHAFLFTGPVGIGKKTIARSFAAALLCRDGTALPDCDCPGCCQFRINAHPDLVTVVPSGNSIKIEQLRELQRTMYLRPLLGKRKVFIFPDAEQLTEAAANSFLKLLEEPPPGIVFIFTAVRTEQILPTIRSRCQIYQLFPVDPDLIAAWLTGRGVPKEIALERAAASQGSPGQALAQNTVSLPQGVLSYQDIIRQDLLQLLKIGGELEKKDRQEIVLILRAWEAEARDELMRLGRSNPAEVMNTAGLRLAHALEKIDRTIRMIESNVNQRLALDQLFIAIKLQMGYN